MFHVEANTLTLFGLLFGGCPICEEEGRDGWEGRGCLGSGGREASEVDVSDCGRRMRGKEGEEGGKVERG